MDFRRCVLATIAFLSVAAVTPAQSRDLVMSLVPAENNEDMLRRFEPMRAYLERKLGEKVKMFAATDYTGVIEAMRKKRVDIAWYGPMSYLLAEQEAGAEAFAVGIRTGSTTHTYKTLIVARCGIGVHSLKDLKGRSVAFVDPASTSGGLVPTYMVKRESGLMPQEFFGKFTYAGSHDAAELAVKNGTVDAAADNDITYNRMLSKGLITRETNCVVAESDPIPGPPLAFRADLPPELKRRIIDAVMNAHLETDISGYIPLSRYVPVTAADYQPVRDMARELGLKKEQMLK